MTELLPVDVQNREDQLLGAAWRRAETALPEGWTLWGLSSNAHLDLREGLWDATAGDTDMTGYPPAPVVWGTADTPAAALDALTAALSGIADRAAGPDASGGRNG